MSQQINVPGAAEGVEFEQPTVNGQQGGLGIDVPTAGSQINSQGQMNTQPITQQTQQPQQQQSYQGMAQQSAPNPTKDQQKGPTIIDLLKTTMSATPLSEKGEHYIEVLQKFLKAKNSKIRFEALSSPAECLAVCSHGDAVILILSETAKLTDNQPTASLFRDAAESLKAKVGNIKLVNVIIVTPQDYEKPEVMGAHLYNVFISREDMNIQGFNYEALKSFQIEVSTNMDVYFNYLNRNNPHGVNARADIALTYSVHAPRENQNNNTADIFNYNRYNKIEFGAVGAYVNFIQSTNMHQGMPKYIPEVHISEITTSLPCDGILPMLIGLAKEHLLDNQLWKAPFGELSGDSRVNIGNLLVDPVSGCTCRVDNIPGRDNFIASYLEPPTLVLDIMEGRARIPGLELFSQFNDDAQAKLLEICRRFSGPYATFPANGKTVYPQYSTWEGYAQQGNVYHDTRYIDFLNMMIHHLSNRSQCQQLLLRYQKPEQKVEIVKQFAPDAVFHYYCHVSVLDPTIVMNLQNAVRNSVRMVNGSLVNGAMDISTFLRAGLAYGPSSSNMLNSSYYNPFMNQVYQLGTFGNQPQPNVII